MEVDKKSPISDEVHFLESSCSSTSSESDDGRAGRKLRLEERLVFVISTVCTIVLSHAAIWIPWLLPFYYAVATPLLMLVRLVLYWKNKWQLFMVDFCYFANAMTYALLWLPDVKFLYPVVFALANGPLLWAMVVYRNSLVYHHTDKTTSIYIHIVPSLLTFVIRWYPEVTSKYWFKPFVPEMPEWSLVWLYLIPLACYIVHSGIYFLIVNVVFRSKDEYVSSYSFLGDRFGPRLPRTLKCCGQMGVFYVFSWVFCLLALLGAPLCYYFFEAHCVMLLSLFLVVTWNGASYYVDVFSVRGFVEDIEQT